MVGHIKHLDLPLEAIVCTFSSLSAAFTCPNLNGAVCQFYTSKSVCRCLRAPLHMWKGIFSVLKLLVAAERAV